MAAGGQLSGGVIAVVLKGYPRLSETFIAQEIHALEQCGLRLRLVSLRHPTDTARHPVHAEIQAPVRYLPEYLHHEPVRVLGALCRVARRSQFVPTLKLWWRDLLRDRSRNRVRRFGQALVLAAELEPDVVHLYAHFLHTPASVARYAACLAQLSWSVSAHAKDIWTTASWEKREKLASATFAVTCTRHNVEHLSQLANKPVELVYHGLDFNRFTTPPARNDAPRDGSDDTRPVRLVSVGRAVEKKGYDILLDALSALPSSLSWRLEHIGAGPLLDGLKAKARHCGIDTRIHFLGPQPQEEVIARYRAADLFVLSNRIAADGDRDGLPNVLMEAQSQRLACVVSDVSAASELIEHRRTGWLVPPEDSAVLSEALRQLIVDAPLRERLASAGEQRVREAFGLNDNIVQLVARLRGATRSAP